MPNPADVVHHPVGDRYGRHTGGVREETVTRIMLALLAEWVASDGQVTVRSIGRRAGFTTHHTWLGLCELRRRGLVNFEDGTKGTIRPTCAVVVPVGGV